MRSRSQSNPLLAVTLALAAIALARGIAINSPGAGIRQAKTASRAARPSLRGPRAGRVLPHSASSHGPATNAVRGRLAAARARRPACRCLLDAIRTHESLDGRQPVGDGGRSLGDYHISRKYWQDGCEFGGVDWSYDTLVWSDPHCRQVIRWYWQRWCPDALRRGDFEALARTHNGGPRGPRKECTRPYWRKIRAILETGQ